MKAVDMTVDDIFRMLYEVPKEVRHHARWVMTKGDLEVLEQKVLKSEPVPAGLATHLVGKPIELVDSIDGVHLAYPAPTGGAVGESALYEPCTKPDCPAHRVGYGHGHLVMYEPEEAV